MVDKNKTIGVTVFTRPSCAKARAVLALLEGARERFPLSVTEIDVSFDAALEIAYGNDVPVVLIDGTERFRGRVDEHELKAVLQTAHMKNEQKRRRERDG